MDEITEWFSNQEWLEDIPFKKIFGAVLRTRGGNGPSEDDDDDGYEDEEEGDDNGDVEADAADGEPSAYQLDYDGQDQDQSHEDDSRDTFNEKGHEDHGFATNLVNDLGKKVQSSKQPNLPTGNGNGNPTVQRSATVPPTSPPSTTTTKAAPRSPISPGKPTSQKIPTDYKSEGKRGRPDAVKPAPVKTHGIVSRRSHAITLILFASFYLSIGILSVVAYGVKGKHWYDREASLLTTILAILGVTLSVLNKMTTQQLTAAFRREKGADLLSKSGLTLKSLQQYDQFLSKSSISILGNQGFRSITMPVGLGVILASAFLKKSWASEIALKPEYSEPVHLQGYAINEASSLLTLTSAKVNTDKNSPYNGFVDPDVDMDDSTFTISTQTALNLTSPLKYGLFADPALFVAAYAWKDTFFEGNTTVDPNTTYYGAPAIPQQVYNRASSYLQIYVPNNPVVMATQIPISEDIWNASVESNYTSSDYFNSTTTSRIGEVVKQKSNETSGIQCYILNDLTFITAYYEMSTIDNDDSIDESKPDFQAAAGFQMYPTTAATYFRSYGYPVYWSLGDYLSDPAPALGSDSYLSIDMTSSNLDEAAQAAADLIQSMIDELGIIDLTNANDTMKDDFKIRLSAISASIALTYAVNYSLPIIQDQVTHYNQTVSYVYQLVPTIIFGKDIFTLIFGLSFLAIGTSIAFWAYKSWIKPYGLELNLATAMSLVANAIDPKAEISKALNEMHGGRRQPSLRAPPPSRPIRSRTTTSSTVGVKKNVEMSEKGGLTKSTNTPSTSAIRRTSPSSTTQVRARRPPPRRRMSPATSRMVLKIGIDVTTKLMRFIDEDGGDQNDS